MNLHIKRFSVRREGVNYGPNSVIYDVPEDEAEKLISESNGTIEAMPERDGNIADEVKDENVADNVNGGNGLPVVDPKKTVK